MSTRRFRNSLQPLNTRPSIPPRPSSWQASNPVQDHGLRYRYDDYTTIDWIHDNIREIMRMRGIKQQGVIMKYYDAMQAWLVLFVVGIGVGVWGVLLEISIDGFEGARRGYCVDRWYPKIFCKNWTSLQGLSFVIVYTTLGLLYTLLSFYIVSSGPRHDNPNGGLSYHAAGSGIPEVKVILGGFVMRGFLGFKTLVLKTAALVFSISAGLALGVQGPLVHIACSIGNVTTRIFQKYSTNDAKRREIMSASCAAGVSVAFGAPIGGVLFSLEEVSYYFPPKTMWRAFFCALVAATTVKLINPLASGKLVKFQVSYDKGWDTIEIIPFMGLGVLGGLYGAFFIKVTNKIRKMKLNSVRFQHYGEGIQIILISLLTSLLSIFIELTQISNTVLVSELFAECKPGNPTANMLCEKDSTMVIKLLWTCLVKSFLMTVTFGSRLPGGVFIPSMVVGGLMGRIIGVLTHEVLSKFTTVKVIPGVYAMIGSAATLSGVTRMTVSLTIVMFEITGGLTYVLPLMSAIMVAKWVSDAFGRDSIYDMTILVKGYPYLNFKRRNLGPQAYVHSIMQTDHVGMLIDTESCYKIGDLQLKLVKMARLHPSLDGGFAIVKSSTDLTLLGYISQTDLKHALDLVVEGKSSNLDYQSMTGSTSPTSPTTLDQNIVFYGLSTDNNHSPQLDSFSTNSETFTDLSQWVDKAPLTVSSASSCELVVELFIKLGIRSLLVVKNGVFVGMVHKKRVLAFLRNRFEEEEQESVGNGAIRLD